MLLVHSSLAGIQRRKGSSQQYVLSILQTKYVAWKGLSWCNNLVTVYAVQQLMRSLNFSHLEVKRSHSRIAWMQCQWQNPKHCIPAPPIVHGGHTYASCLFKKLGNVFLCVSDVWTMTYDTCDDSDWNGVHGHSFAVQENLTNLCNKTCTLHTLWCGVQGSHSPKVFHFFVNCLPHSDMCMRRFKIGCGLSGWNVGTEGYGFCQSTKMLSRDQSTGCVNACI